MYLGTHTGLPIVRKCRRQRLIMCETFHETMCANLPDDVDMLTGSAVCDAVMLLVHNL